MAVSRAAQIGSVALGAAALTLATRRRRRRYDWHGRSVLVAGGSRGLGFVLAELLAHAGARVTIAGRSPEALERARARLLETTGPVATAVCDVRDRAQCERVVADIEARDGALDLLVNNAGVIGVGALDDQRLGDFAEALDTHLWGPLYLMQAALPAMRARTSGTIVNVSSIGGVVGVPHLAPYCTGKFALTGLSQAAGAELAGEGINVMTVWPGLMRTGSPDHARFKGRHRAEYAWFTISDANPLLSVSVDAAARRIMRGVERRETSVMIGAPAQLARALNALAPETTNRLLRVAARLLPPPGGIGAQGRSGAESHSALAPSVLTILDRIAARRGNQ